MPTPVDHEVAEVTVQYSCRTAAADRIAISTSGDAFRVLWPFFEPHQEVQEGFRVLLLDRGNRLKGIYTMSLGGMTGTMADPRLIFSVALRTLSCSIILAHNHPSGQCRPSEEDLRLTRKLVDGGKLLDIQVSDHIILAGPDSYYSFADNCQL
jgi:DNA repair protein RadC